MPKLRVLLSTAGAYPPTTLCPVNGGPVPVKTENFEGEISVYVKGYDGDGKEGDGHEFFAARPEDTFGIVVRGRYLDGVNGDDLIFGNVFERPIRNSLPWGTAIATKCMYFVDPTLELDVYADKPWALSPVLSTMNHLSLNKSVKKDEDIEPPTAMGIFRAVDEDALHVVGRPDENGDVARRRRFFGDAGNRELVTFDKELEAGMEFGSGFLDFNTLSVTLPQPFPLSISLLSYWDGQPVTYVCRRRVAKGESPVQAEGVYWSVAFEIIDEDAKAALEKRGKEVLELKVEDSAVGDKPKPTAEPSTTVKARAPGGSGDSAATSTPVPTEGGAKGEDPTTVTQEVGGETRGLEGGAGGEVGNVVGGEAVGGDDDID